MKVCSLCQTSKDESEFYRCLSNKDGLQYRCKACQAGLERETRAHKVIDSSIISKMCSKCGSDKSISDFYINLGTKDGYNPSCKTCAYNQHKDFLKIVEREVPIAKVCIDCGIEKPSSEFTPDKSRKDGLFDRCHDCHNTVTRDYQREYRHGHYQEHREQWCATTRRWGANHPEKKLMYNHIRRARLESTISTLTPDEWKQILDAYGNKCLACGTTENIAMDHIIPIARGGTNTGYNVQPLCMTCNLSKGVKTIDYRPFIVELHEVVTR